MGLDRSVKSVISVYDNVVLGVRECPSGALTTRPIGVAQCSPMFTGSDSIGTGSAPGGQGDPVRARHSDEGVLLMNS